MNQPSGKVSVFEKIGYGSGDFASNLFWQTFMYFLPIFYTDVFGLPTAIAAASTHEFVLITSGLTFLGGLPLIGYVPKLAVGCLLVLAGSRAYGGAAHLTGLGALRSGAGGPAPMLEELELEEVERLLVRKALDRFGGNVSQAASALGLSRSALYRRIKRHDL